MNILKCKIGFIHLPAIKLPLLLLFSAVLISSSLPVDDPDLTVKKSVILNRTEGSDNNSNPISTAQFNQRRLIVRRKGNIRNVRKFYGFLNLTFSKVGDIANTKYMGWRHGGGKLKREVTSIRNNVPAVNIHTMRPKFPSVASAILQSNGTSELTLQQLPTVAPTTTETTSDDDEGGITVWVVLLYIVATIAGLLAAGAAFTLTVRGDCRGNCHCFQCFCTDDY